jgi:RimJ/RimL family protein N-acetyltransferase
MRKRCTGVIPIPARFLFWRAWPASRAGASIALAEKPGFKREGLLRDNLRVGDEWRDDMLYALLATERGG